MNNLLSVISLIPEFRKGNHLVYPIDYLLLVAFCTMMCNQTSWHAMEDYAEIHQKDLRKLYFKISGKVLRRYTPSHDVFCAVFQTLSPITFHNAFKSWLLEVYSSVGEHICIGPKCQLYTPTHPMDAEERRRPVETAHPITIGEDCWLCGGVIVCPGVTIGDRSVIAAGSVVTRDIPADCLAAGNPAVVKRRL
ncbi:transposase family protein [uncultured Porphyromonas sp.]|uniref:transposase family protein n=1 Tax=uncultured Porphyromonas sp. TaxID=159274 RepID=UPI002622C865|nr:transposase family protein [uncultured Porphyromonas sp.]